MSVLATEWMPRAQQLAQDLVAAGKLWSAPWREAICAVPRHELVPDVLRRDSDGSWHRLNTATEQGRREWLDQVYSNRALLTAVADRGESRSLRSSSSMPGLMTRMLEALQARDGDRVLEIGTGTGYNAALLAHRLTDANVFSVDVEPDLVDLARQRLAGIGYHPTLVVANGAAGLPEHALFDRIIATARYPRCRGPGWSRPALAGSSSPISSTRWARAAWSASPATPTALRDASMRPTPPS